VEDLQKAGANLEIEDDSWMVVETANANVEDVVERRQRVSLSVHIGSYVYRARFIIYDVKGFVIVRVLGKRWMRDINGRYHINQYNANPLLRQHQFTTYVVLVAEPTGLFLRNRDWTRSWVND
jgi:hypothetical protein